MGTGLDCNMEKVGPSDFCIVENVDGIIKDLKKKKKRAEQLRRL